MTEMIEVAKYIRGELRMAESYAHEALKHREQYPELSQRYYRAAQEHMETAEELHDGATRIIGDAKRRSHEDAEDMQALWTYERGMMMDDMDCINRKLEMYKS